MLINRREKVGIKMKKTPKAFIDYSQKLIMSIKIYNDKKVLIEFNKKIKTNNKLKIKN